MLCDAAARRVIEQLVRNPRRRDFANTRLAGSALALLAEASASHGRAGLGTALALANPSRESVPESLVAGHLHLAGLPTPVYQHRIASRIGWLYPDLYWPEANLIGECDGAVKYARAEAYVDEKEREQVLRDLGYRIVRWLAKEIPTRSRLRRNAVKRNAEPWARSCAPRRETLCNNTANLYRLAGAWLASAAYRLDKEPVA